MSFNGRTPGSGPVNLGSNPSIPAKLLPHLPPQSALVGGVVRDLLLGRPALDWDVAVLADASQVAHSVAEALEGRLVPLDAERGIFRIVVDDQLIDITRAEQNLTHDLTRRDLTINAMALPLTPAAVAALAGGDWADFLVDPTGGLQDLHSGTIRAISEANLVDDPLRLLRVFRFASQFGFHVEPTTRQWLMRHASKLRQVAPERILKELYLTLQGHVSPLLDLFRETGVLTALFPELLAMEQVPANDHHHLALFEHSLEVVRQLENLDIERLPEPLRIREHLQTHLTHEHRRLPWLKLGALLHDVGKPATYTLDGDRARFIGHEKVGAEMAEAMAGRLKMATGEKRYVCGLVRHHLRPGLLTNDFPPSKRALYRYFRDLEDSALDVALLGLADRLSTQGPAISEADNQRFFETVALVAETAFNRSVQAPPVINGRQLMEALGLTPGPEVGRLLELIREAQATGEVTCADDAINWAQKQRAHPA